MTTLEITLICLDFELLCYLAFKVAEAIGVEGLFGPRFIVRVDEKLTAFLER